MMRALLDDLLDLAKIEVGRMEVECMTFDLRGAVNDVLRMWRPQAREKGLRLVIEVKNGFVPEAILEQLYKLTPMEDSFGINAVALVAQFYVALYPIGGPNLDTQTFFQLYLAGPLLIILYCGWKLYSWFKRPADRPLFIKLKDIDIYTGMREGQFAISGDGVTPAARKASIEELQAAKKKKTPKKSTKMMTRTGMPRTLPPKKVMKSLSRMI